jgi:drug/metabolite transporter (DMT)-like permease
MRGMNSVEIASVRIFTATLLVLPVSLLILGVNVENVDRSGLFALAYASVCGTFLGMLLDFYIINRFGAVSSATVAYIIPLVAVLGGVLVLRETVTVTILFGMGLICTGLALIQKRSGEAKFELKHPS